MQVLHLFLDKICNILTSHAFYTFAKLSTLKIVRFLANTKNIGLKKTGNEYYNLLFFHLYFLEQLSQLGLLFIVVL